MTKLEFSKSLLLCVVILCALTLVGCKSGKGEEVYFSSASPSLSSSEQGEAEQSSTVVDGNAQTDTPTGSRDEYTETDDVMLPDNGEGVKPSGSSQTQSPGQTGSVSSDITADTSSKVTGSSSQTVVSSDNSQTDEQSSGLEGSSSEEEITSSETSSKEPSVKDPIVLPDDIW